MDITPQQLCAVLQKAALLRTDIKRAVIKPNPDDPKLLIVDVIWYTDGRRVQIDASGSKCLDGRTCGQILVDWLGDHPRVNPVQRARESKALKDQRDLYYDHTPIEVIAVLKAHKKNPPPAPPRSKFDWKAPRPTAENPTGKLEPTAQMAEGPPDPVEATKDPNQQFESIDEKTVVYQERLYRHVLAEGVFKATNNEILIDGHMYTKCFTKSEMIEQGMDDQARSHQYRRQRGKHPDDESAIQNG